MFLKGKKIGRSGKGRGKRKKKKSEFSALGKT